MLKMEFVSDDSLHLGSELYQRKDVKRRRRRNKLGTFGNFVFIRYNVCYDSIFQTPASSTSLENNHHDFIGIKGDQGKKVENLSNCTQWQCTLLYTQLIMAVYSSFLSCNDLYAQTMSSLPQINQQFSPQGCLWRCSIRDQKLNCITLSSSAPLFAILFQNLYVG